MDNFNFNNDEFDEKEGKLDKKKILTNALSIGGGIVFSVIVLFSLYIVFRPQVNDEQITSDVFTQEQIDRLEKAAKIIEKDFLYEYDKDKMVDGAIEGMVNSLENVYTYYETEEEFQESLNSGSNSNYVGIGVHLTYDKDNDAIRVLGTVPNSPAEAVGIQSGDVILKVDDLIINLDTYTEGVNAIRGEQDTKVKLTIKRGEELLEVEATRATITENNVTSEIIDGIGYIRVYAFDNGIYDQFKEAYYALRDQNIKGLVIDLRNNPGGYVSDTINMLNLLLPKCDVLRLVDKNGSEKVYKTDDKEQIDIPLAVIVNQNSASASEIFSSAIKDSQKGVVVGTQTFGKGVVQYVEVIKGHGAIDIVAAQYFTPSGVVIQDNGIEPNYIVEVEEEYKNSTYIPRDKDTQLQRALDYIKEQL
ncbi:MAG: S41 family peptidase [Clostridia bacterium]